MNANLIGKTLVFVHTVVSIIALSWAAAVFLQFTDWGWKEPRKELDYRVPSEFDRRSATLAVALKARDVFYGDIKPAQADRMEAEKAFADNHLFYMSELERLKKAPDEIEVKEIKYTDGVLDLEGGKPIGKPVQENPLPEIKKSYEAYMVELKKLQKEADVVMKERQDWIQKNKDITQKLNGFDDAGKRTKAGLYDLADEEAKALAQAKYEIEYLTPIWVNALKESEVYGERRGRLEKALDRVMRAKPK